MCGDLRYGGLDAVGEARVDHRSFSLDPKVRPLTRSEKQQAASAGDVPETDTVGVQCLFGGVPLFVLSVVPQIALEPVELRMALEGWDICGDAIQVPAVAGDAQSAA